MQHEMVIFYNFTSKISFHVRSRTKVFEGGRGLVRVRVLMLNLVVFTVNPSDARYHSPQRVRKIKDEVPLYTLSILITLQ